MKKDDENADVCPAQALLKLLAGKWKPQIFRMCLAGPVRFSTLLRDIGSTNRQSLSVALKELEQSGLLSRTVISEKPLHVEYFLTGKGKEFVPVFETLEGIADR